MNFDEIINLKNSEQDNKRVLGLFPSPMIQGQIREFEQKEINKIESMVNELFESVKNRSESKISSETLNKDNQLYEEEDTYIFDTDELSGLKEYLENIVNDVAKNVYKDESDSEYYITQSWINVLPPGGFHHRHHHVNSIFSGTLYIKTIENDSIIFNAEKHSTDFLRYFKSNSRNEWNSVQYILEVNDGDFVLFPSYIDHEVPYNNSKELRVSIAFNTFVRGTIGETHNLSLLELN
jgi:uncharacterized protein (TIGR02466 family)